MAPIRVAVALSVVFILVLTPAMLGPAAALPMEVILIPWKAPWMHGVTPVNACQGFDEPNYLGPCVFRPGVAPFGNNDQVCGLNVAITPWDVAGASDLLVWQEVLIPAGLSKLRFDYHVDDSLILYLNGNTIHGSYEIPDCAMSGSTASSAPSGVVKIAARVRDGYGNVNGNLAFFEMQVTAS